MEGNVIKVENLSKKYLIKSNNKASYLSLREELSHSINNLFNKRGTNKKKEWFWALKDINFTVRRGEILGIVGPNGAGKSTLLKILSRITYPSTGKVTIKGRVGALLEVGTGFHPELTGRENIFLSGSILGLNKNEIQKKFDEIVNFSGVEKYLDNPVKRYSYGMRLRLGFSVAAHLEPEILLVDEILAVGDSEFQKKCLGKINEVANIGRTVLFVSHNLGTIKSLCTQCIFIANGKIKEYSSTEKTLNIYKNWLNSRENINEKIKIKGDLANFVDFIDLSFNQQSFKQGGGQFISPNQELTIDVTFFLKKELLIQINLGIYRENIRIFTLQDLPQPKKSKGETHSVFKIPKQLLRPGFYTIGVGGLENGKNTSWFWLRDFIGFQIIEEWENGIEEINHGIINVFSQSKRIDQS